MATPMQNMRELHLHICTLQGAIEEHVYLGILCRKADISIRLRSNASSSALAPEAQRAPSRGRAPVRSACILPCAQSTAP